MNPLLDELKRRNTEHVSFYDGAQWGEAYVYKPRWFGTVWLQRVKDAWLVLIGRESIGGW